MKTYTFREKGVALDNILKGNYDMSFEEFHQKASGTILSNTGKSNYIKCIHYRKKRKNKPAVKTAVKIDNDKTKRSYIRKSSANLIVLKEIDLDGMSSGKKDGIMIGVGILNESKKANIEVIERINPNVLEVRERM